MNIDIAIGQLGLSHCSYNANPKTGEIYQWYGPDDQPTEAELQAAWKEYEAEQQKIEYKRKRKAEYPSVEEQLDMLYEDMENNTTNWKDAIRVVKQRHPKPTRTLG